MTCCRKTKTHCTRTVFALLLSVGWILSIVAVASCRFVDILDGASEEYAATGLYSHLNINGRGSCERHDTTLSFSHKENVARVSGVLAPMLGIVVFLCTLGESRCSCRLILRMCLFLATLFQSLTFLWLGSTSCGDDLYHELTTSTPCTLNVGGKASVVATLLFAMCAFLVSCLPLPYIRSDIKEKNSGNDYETDLENDSGLDDIELNCANKGVYS